MFFNLRLSLSLTVQLFTIPEHGGRPVVLRLRVAQLEIGSFPSASCLVRTGTSRPLLPHAVISPDLVVCMLSVSLSSYVLSPVVFGGCQSLGVTHYPWLLEKIFFHLLFEVAA